LRRFSFERHHQVHNLARFRAAIQEVPGLDERCLSAYPMVLVVYKAAASENGDKVVKVTMDVGYRDYGFRRFD